MRRSGRQEAGESNGFSQPPCQDKIGIPPSPDSSSIPQLLVPYPLTKTPPTVLIPLSLLLLTTSKVIRSDLIRSSPPPTLSHGSHRPRWSPKTLLLFNLKPRKEYTWHIDKQFFSLVRFVLNAVHCCSAPRNKLLKRDRRSEPRKHRTLQRTCASL